MPKLNIVVALLVAVISWTSTALAQRPMIDDAAITRLIETFPVVVEKVEGSVEGRQGRTQDNVLSMMVNTPQEMATQLNAVVVAKGYTSYADFLAEAQVILQAYAFHTQGGLDGVMAAARAEIERSTALTEEQKQAMLAQIEVAAKDAAENLPDEATLAAVAVRAEEIAALLDFE